LVPKPAAVSRFNKLRTAGVAQSLARLQEPRLDVFPSPAPLSEEESLLVSLVRQSPESAGAFPEQGEAVASSRVPDLNIPALEMKDLPSDTTDRTR
jgi:hypothetical protein